uniref:Transcription initiation factor TFIID subunit 9 n=1 Tax=Chenopodium quinoa TaxID=63459 RepID=A0A803NAV7_CHEQI
MDEGEEDLPRDAKIIKSLLKFMGVEEHEPRVVHQFLDLWYGYVVDVLTDAQVYYEHAGKTSIDCDDVKLTIQSKVNFSFSQPPPREHSSNNRVALKCTFTFVILGALVYLILPFLLPRQGCCCLAWLPSTAAASPCCVTLV